MFSFVLLSDSITGGFTALVVFGTCPALVVASKRKRSLFRHEFPWKSVGAVTLDRLPIANLVVTALARFTLGFDHFQVLALQADKLLRGKVNAEKPQHVVSLRLAITCISWAAWAFSKPSALLWWEIILLFFTYPWKFPGGYFTWVDLFPECPLPDIIEFPKLGLLSCSPSWRWWGVVAALSVCSDVAAVSSARRHGKLLGVSHVFNIALNTIPLRQYLFVAVPFRHWKNAWQSFGSS